MPPPLDLPKPQSIAQPPSPIGAFGDGSRPAGVEGAGGDSKDPESILGSLASDAEVAAQYKALVLAQIARERQKLAEMQTELFYTNWLGRAIFVVVHAILGLGLWMSWREFREAQRKRNKAQEIAQQEIQLSLEGIALKTQLHGILILGFAAGFYFMYLKFVYPVVLVGD